MNIKHNKYFAIVSLALLASCAAVPSLQDGKVLPKNSLEITPYAMLGKEKDVTIGKRPEADEDANKLRPVIGFKTRYGLGQVDIGCNVDFSSNFGLSAKYQLTPRDQNAFAVSIGAESGFNFLSLIYNKLQAYYSVPLYLSYHPTTKISLYATPRYIGFNEHWWNSKNAVNNQQENKYMISYGLLFGKQHKWGVEVMQPLDGNFKQSVVTVAYAVRVGFK